MSESDQSVTTTASDLLVIDSVHEFAAGKQIVDRIAIYRAHARTTARRLIAEHLFECADELETAERRCQQLQLDFKRRQIS